VLTLLSHVLEFSVLQTTYIIDEFVRGLQVTVLTLYGPMLEFRSLVSCFCVRTKRTNLPFPETNLCEILFLYETTSLIYKLNRR